MTPKELRQYYQSDEFLSESIYDGSDLGAVCTGDKTVFKLWSPLAAGVLIHLYGDGGDAPCRETAAMEQEEHGVWVWEKPENLHGVYYDYQISFDGDWTPTADPYAKACGVNGSRSMVVDLSRTDPEGWEADRPPEKQAEDIIYELHVKEFSWDDSAGFPQECRGKYTAFLCDNTTLHGDGIHPTGIPYLQELGVTHIQLMPVYDYGSVDEAGPKDQFNWGYDPMNYNVPEGSYSSDVFHGEVRITELKSAIAALHRHGFRVIMDVVYNHTYRQDSWLQRTVPYYYYRQWEDGSISNGSCCGNDIASERPMCARYILDSILYWAGEYHVDGFRFDLMGLLDTGLMNRIQEELDRIYGPGEKLVYGEPWAADQTPMETGYHPAKKDYAAELDSNIGMFCDNTRDAVKGHVFELEKPGFVNGGHGLEMDILRSVSAWCGFDSPLPIKAPSQVLTYVSAHDNLTLWDKLVSTVRPDCGFHDRPKEVLDAYKLAAAVYFTCQGHLFLLSGEEFARTKEGVEDSYCSPIAINRLDYDRAYEYAELAEYYRGLIALRKNLPGLCDKSSQAATRITCKKIEMDGVVSFLVDNRKTGGKHENAVMADSLFIAYNSTKEAVVLELPCEGGDWKILADGEDSFRWKKRERKRKSGATIRGGSVVVPAVSAVVVGNRRV